MRLVSVRECGTLGEKIGMGEMWEEGTAKYKDVDARPGMPELKCIRSCRYLSFKALLFTNIAIKKSTKSCVCVKLSYTSSPKPSAIFPLVLELEYSLQVVVPSR
jgi:hypothetical protein